MKGILHRIADDLGLPADRPNDRDAPRDLGWLDAAAMTVEAQAQTRLDAERRLDDIDRRRAA